MQFGGVGEKMASMKLWKDVATEVFKFVFCFFSTLSIGVSVFHQSTYLLQVVLELIPGGEGGVHPEQATSLLQG